MSSVNGGFWGRQLGHLELSFSFNHLEVLTPRKDPSKVDGVGDLTCEYLLAISI